MKCPFCGGEMRPGALRARVRPNLLGDAFSWVPLSEEERAAMEGEVTLLPGEADLASIPEALFSNVQYYKDAWLCLKCKKAVCVFPMEEVPAYGPVSKVLEGPPPTEDELLRKTPPASRPEADAPAERPRPRGDPWDEGGPFHRKKKPKWER